MKKEYENYYALINIENMWFILEKNKETETLVDWENYEHWTGIVQHP